MRAHRLLVAIAAIAGLTAPPAAQGQNPTKPAVPRVDSVRVDTLRPAAADSAKRVAMPKPPEDTTRRPGLFGPGTDLGLDVRSRIEYKADKRTDARCANGLFPGSNLTCQSAWLINPDVQFSMRSVGKVGDRVHVNVDYDTQREFDASNAVNIFYEGKTADRLQRLEVGNVAFTLPSTRFLASGVPSGNYGLQATGRVGRLRFQGIAAQQKGNIVQDRTFYVGARTLQSGEREVKDNEVEPRRFFFTVDPLLLRGAYPNIDILNRTQLASLATALPDTLRPRRVMLYRVQFGTQPQNPNGPRFRLRDDPARGAQTYDVLREGVDYYLDPSQLWFALVRPLNPNNERLVVAYTVRLSGRDTTYANTGGTPDLQFTGRDQVANLVWDPDVQPGAPAFRREIRAVYRVGGEELIRSSTRVRIVSGAGEQEKPAAGSFATFLQMFGLAQSVNPAAFDLENRLWPRPSDPNYSAAAGGSAGLASAASMSWATMAGASSSGRIIRDHFIIFPSVQPFARADSGLVVPGNPSNDAIYVTPNEYLYSPQHPANVYRLKLAYETEATGEDGAVIVGSVQVRPGSERVILDGRPLVRGVDYRLDYDLGRLTFARPDTLFNRQRTVTVRYEENPTFALAATPTTLFGVTSTLSVGSGELNFMALQQSQSTSFTRPQLGLEQNRSLVAGVNGQLAWEVGPLTRLVNRLPFVATSVPSRVSVQGEFATSRPQGNAKQQAYVESFEGEAGVTVNLADQNWSLSSQPADGHVMPRRLGANPFDLRRAATVAYQSIGLSFDGIPLQIRGDSIDPNASLFGPGLTSNEQLLWLTLYPLSVGGQYNTATRSYAWSIGNPLPGRRYRSVQTVLSPAGTDLSRAENLEFWTLVDTSALRRGTNPTLVFDVGEISENRVAFAPETLTVRAGAKPDSTYRGRKLQGFDVLNSERDPISHAFNAEVNDTGLPGDVVDTLVVNDNGTPSRAFNVPICSGATRELVRLGDTRANCTVRNNRLDEEDIDLDNVLNLPSSARDRERLLRFVVDLSDPRKWVRFGRTFTQRLDSLSTAHTLQWVLVRVPFRAADDTVNDPLLRRVRALRVTIVSGGAVADDQFTQIPLARLRLIGAPWVKRSDQTLAGVAGEAPAGGYTLSSLIGTADRGTLNGDDYQSPPGVTDEPDSRVSQFAATSIQINEHSLRLQGGNLPLYGRAEAYYRFPNGQQSFMGYQQLRLWARGRRVGWGPNGELQMYVKIGRDANNFYLYRTTVMSGPGQEAWNPEVLVDFNRFFALRQKLQNAYLANRGDTLQCTGVDAALVTASRVPGIVGQQRYVACDGGYMVYTVEPGAAPPNLAAVQEMAVGFVRLPPSNGAPSAIGPADSLELWVDDIRLGQVVNHAGYAGQVSVALSAADIADVRVGFTKRDPWFRQLAEQPTFVDDRVLDVVGTLHIEKLLPAGLGVAMPLTITHVSASSTPMFLSGTDIPGAGVPDLRAPGTGVTTYALSVRRTAPLGNAILGALVDNLGLTSTYTTGDSRNEYQRGNNDNFALTLDYNVAAEARTASVPSIIGLPLGLPRSSSAQDTVNTPQVFRWNPTVIRVSSGVVRSSDLRYSFLKPAAAADDSARIARAEQNLWRNASTLELRPTNELTARWDFISLRDLRDYGDTTSAARSVAEGRARLFGTDVGMERERSLLTSFAYAPQRSEWIKPRFDFGTQYGMLRDPNLSSFIAASGNTVTNHIPHRLTASQTLGGGVSIDIGRALTLYGADSSLARRLAGVFAPLDVTLNRSLLSAFDDAPAGAPLGFQLGFGGVDAFRRVNEQLAAATGLTNAFAASQTLRLPGNVALLNRFRRTTTRSWTRRAADAQSVADAGQTVFPDMSLRWSWQPPTMIQPLVKSLGANAGFALSTGTIFLPADGLDQAPELRANRVRSIPLNTTIAWGFARGLTTSAGYNLTRRTDSLPGSLAEGRSEDLSFDVGRPFRVPKALGLTTTSDVRTHLSWQQSRTNLFVSDLARAGTSRLADNGRSAVSLNADTDLSETLVFTLQGSRVVTYDNNFNRRTTQFVLSTVLQVQFFGEQK